jgi:tetratricopeptide (TPR) repeat protein
VDHSVDQNILSDAGRGESASPHGPLAAADGGGFAQSPLPSSGESNASPPADDWVRVGSVWGICGFLLLAVGLVFGQTVHQEFVGFDDPVFVYENPNVTSGLTSSGLWWALTDGPFGEWCPLSTLSHMLDCEIYGLEPAGHHLNNVLLHAASSVLLFLLLLRMTAALWPSAWVAAIFAIHPLHVESVAWVSERRDVLSGLFFMLTLLAYALYAERPSIWRYLAVAGFFALGLMAKPILVTVPCLLLLLDYWPLARFQRMADARSPANPAWWLVLEKIPLMVLAGATSWIVLATHTVFQSANPVERLSLATRLANAPVAYADYLIQSFYPAGLTPFYPHPGDHLPMVWVVGASVLLVAITAVVLYGWRRLPYLLVGWLWFLGMLVPVIGLVQLVAIARADRYTYLSQIGLSIALAWGVWNLYQSRQSRQVAAWQGWMLAVVSGATVLALAATAWLQTTYWHDSEALWTHTLACNEHNALAHYNLGYTYAMQEKTDEAIPHLRQAVAGDSIDPQLIAKAHCVLADCLTRQGKADEALAHYEQAVHIFPDGSTFHDRLAKAFTRRGTHDRAIFEWREVIRLDPHHLRGYLGLIDALLADGDTAEAVAQCHKILDEEPNALEAVVVLGAALAAEGKVEEAIPPLMRALEIDPGNVRAHFCLGLALYDLGRSSSAITHLNEAIRLQPDNVPALWQTAWILATSPDPSIRDGERGITLATQAIQLSGGQDPHTFDALAAALAETEKFSAAAEVADQASALALAHGDDALVDAIEQRTRLYRQGLPYRKPVSSSPTADAPHEAPE